VNPVSPLRAERLLPPHAPGMRIGLFGGTFDPAHEAHLGASLLALKRLKLDRVWWLVTPGNPLKNTSGLAPLAKRIATARSLTRHPRIDVTGLEAVIKTRYTYDTILWLKARCPRVRFVWIMGADNLRSFHRWQRWRGIAKLVPIVVIDRLGPSLYAGASPAGQSLRHARIPEHAVSSLALYKPPVWAFVHGLKSPLSSTELRAMRREGTRTPGKTAKTKRGKLKSKAKSKVKRKAKSAAKSATKSAKSAKTRSKSRRSKLKAASRKAVKVKKTKRKTVSAKRAKPRAKKRPAKRPLGGRRRAK
jgi:nicotinate-nucleotide adenylyltransferase